MSRRRAAATLAVAVLVVPLAATAAYAAPPLSRADAEAVSLAVAGNGQGTGPVEATYGGGEEVVSGPETPAAPSGGFVDLGVLTQQAAAGNGFAAACAGVAGSGGGIIQIGDGSCLRPGDNVNGSLTDLSLGDLDLRVPEGLELPAQTPLPTELPGGLDDLTDEIDAAIGQVTAPLGVFGLQLRLDAIEGRCAVEGASPTGSASITNAALVAEGAGRSVTLLNLPANPGPNTEVLTDLSKVVDVVLSGFQTQFDTALDRQLDPVGEQLIEPIRQQLVTGIRTQLEGQLAPLEDDVLRVVLNEQTRPAADSIRVTALRAEVLPAAREQLDASALDLKIGSVGCGPVGAVAAETVDQPEAAPAPAPNKPALPTGVSAGLAGEDDGTDVLPLAVLAVGAVAAGAAGVGAVRRHRALRD